MYTGAREFNKRLQMTTLSEKFQQFVYEWSILDNLALIL